MKTLEITITFKLPESDSISSLLESIAYKVWAMTMKRFGASISYRVNYHDSLTLEKILHAVSNFTGISKADMLKDTRKQEIVEARQIGMKLSRDMIKPKPYTSVIGAYFGGKDHATVLYACKTVQNYLDTEPLFRQNYQKIKESLLT